MRVEQIAWKVRASCRLDTFTLEDEFKHCYGSHDDVLDEHGLAIPAICAQLGLK
jgi:transketolase